MWAGTDGSFPGESGNAGAEVAEPARAIGFDGVDGVGDACTDWDAGILIAAAGDRPAPTAPPPFSSTAEMAELKAGPEAGQGAGQGADEGEHTFALRYS